MQPAVPMSNELAVAYGVIAVLAILAVTLFVKTLVTGIRKLHKEQRSILNKAQCFNNVGAHKAAALLSDLAILDAHDGIHKLESFLETIQTERDALAFFEDMWYFQLDMRMRDSGQRQRIQDRITVDLQSQTQASLSVVNDATTPITIKADKKTTIVQ